MQMFFVVLFPVIPDISASSPVWIIWTNKGRRFLERHVAADKHFSASTIFTGTIYSEQSSSNENCSQWGLSIIQNNQFLERDVENAVWEVQRFGPDQNIPTVIGWTAMNCGSLWLVSLRLTRGMFGVRLTRWYVLCLSAVVDAVPLRLCDFTVLSQRGLLAACKTCKQKK